MTGCIPCEERGIRPGCALPVKGLESGL
jgi:hypothetical protein